MKTVSSNFDALESRLVMFAVNNLKIAEGINNSYAGQHLKNQLIRSGSSPALNYAEARFAESRKDFVHKIKIVLKELQETRVCLNIILNTNYYRGKSDIPKAIRENNELIATFIANINTAQKNKAEMGMHE